MLHCGKGGESALCAILRDNDWSDMIILAVVKGGSIDMYDIPETGFLRLPQVLSVIPVGKTCWWQGVKSGRYPKPVKLSARCTAWRVEDIRELIKDLSETPPSGNDNHADH